MLTRDFSRAGIALLADIIVGLEETSPSAVETLANAVKLGAKQSLSITASGGSFEIDFDLVNDYGERTRVIRFTVKRDQRD